MALGDVTGGTGKAGVPGVTGKRLLAVSTAEARCKDIHAARRPMEAGIFLEDGAVSSSGDVLGAEGRIAQPDLSTIEGEGTTELMDADVDSGQVDALGSRGQIDDEATDTVSGGPRVAACWTSAGAETAMRTGNMPIVQELSAASVKRTHLGLEDKGNDRPSGQVLRSIGAQDKLGFDTASCHPPMGREGAKTAAILNLLSIRSTARHGGPSVGTYSAPRPSCYCARSTTWGPRRRQRPRLSRCAKVGNL